jgi:acyl-CoA synthetase (AMP-forming)/AMP-acid ligase II/aryl carrier-like protein
MNATTLTALMEANRGAERSVVYLEGERDARPVRFAALHERALGILYHLQELGARAGDRIILLLSDNEPFVDAFWAAVLGGIIPVPVAPGISDEHRHKLLRIAHKLERPFIYTERRLLERIGNFAAANEATGLFESLRERAFIVDELESIGRAGKPHRARPEDVAFIQFSSGSTSTPKGVVLTHANLLANIRGISAAAALHGDDVGLSWMPLTHDMGLIGFHLIMFANRMQSHLMPTELFVRRPLLWLKLAGRVRASMLCSPNFGYRHYLKALGTRTPGDIDLSAVRLIFNGAEPISAELCDEFLTRLAPTGLKRTSMFPVYGLAEGSLAVSFPPPGTPARTVRFDRHGLRLNSAARLAEPGSRNALTLMSVGRAVPACELRIVDDADIALPERHVGHIQIRGDNVTRGYFEEPQANAAAFTGDGWLRTGDLGLTLDGDLFIAGRHKEILFVNGQNYYPHDLERMAEGIPGLELGKLVVAGARATGADGERLVAFVLHRGELGEFLPLARQLVRTLSTQAGLELDAVVPVRRIPKTTSGKIQRHLLEQEYEDGAFDAQLAELERLGGTHPASAQLEGAIEQQLQTLCESELDGRRIDPEESLFDLGASSLKLISIHERIEQRWPGAVEMTDIFENPTIRALSGFIESKIVAHP